MKAFKAQEKRASCDLPAGLEAIAFREMSLADLDEVMKIERTSFASPWSERFFIEEIQAPCARALLAVAGERIVGYVIFWLLPDEVDVHNLAVHTAYRRRGIGRRLLQQVIGQARGRGSSRVTLEVRRSNTAAQRLYESLGFRITGVRRAYYADNGEDALTMALVLRR
ncbi:MAG TPA: ribosomal protein S18-alanine N-acetyltransferase [candidate division Zixibacteria bacterium]|nr:ribosomal protein S18-alanine N-acetyltransferase [candidate division Zixibacteria bacterium]